MTRERLLEILKQGGAKPSEGFVICVAVCIAGEPTAEQVAQYGTRTTDIIKALAKEFDK